MAVSWLSGGDGPGDVWHERSKSSILAFLGSGESLAPGDAGVRFSIVGKSDFLRALMLVAAGFDGTERGALDD